MTELERQLTEALKRLSGQYERERRRQSEQVEALRRRVERQTEENDTLRRQIERLSGQVTRLTGGSGTHGVTLRGGG
ncbi:MbeD/MobD family mobilization/exclusion protein [Candidatus Palauibacter sp.]|uniref:MbeD/MobD family mobilization/exclusion protein n=1 Tax=Candidatus Palauibacter sp. TaxID=3101350 RepID=UPI003B5BD890